MLAGTSDPGRTRYRPPDAAPSPLETNGRVAMAVSVVACVMKLPCVCHHKLVRTLGLDPPGGGYRTPSVDRRSFLCAAKITTHCAVQILVIEPLGRRRPSRIRSKSPSERLAPRALVPVQTGSWKTIRLIEACVAGVPSPAMRAGPAVLSDRVVRACQGVPFEPRTNPRQPQRYPNAKDASAASHPTREPWCRIAGQARCGSPLPLSK